MGQEISEKKNPGKISAGPEHVKEKTLRMEDLQTIGRWLVIGGISLAVVGGLIWLLGKYFDLQNIPGTIKIQASGLTCVFPVLASIVLSVILTILINVIIRGLNR